MTPGGNFWTLFTQEIWKDLYAVLHGVTGRGEGRATRERGGGHVSPHADDIPGAVGLARDPPNALGLLDGGVGDAELAGDPRGQM